MCKFLIFLYCTRSGTNLMLNEIHFIFCSSLFFDYSSPNPKSATPWDLRCQNLETSSSCATKKSKTMKLPNSLFNYGERLRLRCVRLRNYGSVWIVFIVIETENWKHWSKIIFKCVNSIVGPIFNIFKCMNSAAIMREQWFLSPA